MIENMNRHVRKWSPFPSAKVTNHLVILTTTTSNENTHNTECNDMASTIIPHHFLFKHSIANERGKKHANIIKSAHKSIRRINTKHRRIATVVTAAPHHIAVDKIYLIVSGSRLSVCGIAEIRSDTNSRTGPFVLCTNMRGGVSA